MTRQAVLAARVSSDGQAKYGYSIDTQFKAMRKYAVEHDFTIAAEIADDCCGTIPIRERPGGAKLYKFIDGHKADAIIFYTLDRATRDEDLIEISVLRRDLRQAGIELHWCDSGKSDLGTMGGVIDTLKAAGAAEERKKIVERTQRGLRAKAESGKWPGVHPEPYGYRREGKAKDVRILIFDPEAQIVRRIFWMYTGKHGYPYSSLRAISNVLNSEGVPSPGRTDRAGGHTGQEWYPVTVRCLLQNTAYIGEFHCLGVTINLPEMAVIDRVTFNQAQEQFATNAARAVRNRKHEYLLAGFIKCACDHSMSGASKTPPRYIMRYYECSTTRNHAGGTRHKICTETGIRADAIEEPVWNWLRGIMNDDESLRHGLRRRRERNARELAPKRDRIAALDEMIEEGTRQFRRLNAEMGHYKEDDDPALLALQLDARRVGQQLTAWKREHNSLESEMQARDMTEAEEQSFLADIAALREGMQDADYETKRHYLQRMGVACKLRRDAQHLRWLDVSCKLTGDTKSLPIAYSCPTVT
jgi:DNA invertase Pin-like site-specific DNA recombinase